MIKNEFLLDKFSQIQNHPMLIAEFVYKNLKKETHLNELIPKLQRKRKKQFNIIEESRILLAIGMLVALGKVRYYKGHVSKI